MTGGAPDATPALQVTAAGRTLVGVVGGTAPADVAALSRALREALQEHDGHDTPVRAEHRPILVPLAPGDPRAALAEVAGRIEAGGALIPATTDLIVQTSGSTSGRGHLVGTSVAALRASALATAARLDGHGQWLATLPAHHVAGVQVLVRSALAGTTPVVLDTTAGFDTAALAEAANATLQRAAEPTGDHTATGDDSGARPLLCYVSLVPTQLVRVLRDEAALAALRPFAAILVGGAALRPDLRAAAQEAGLRVVATYGMSETSGGCVYDGVPLDGVGVHVDTDVQAEGPHPAREGGRILLSGPMLADAYLEDGAASAATFTTREGTAVVATSDRGTWDGSTLRVLGRVDEVIVTGGVKVDPVAVETVIGALEQVAEVCVVGVPDPEWGQAVVAVVVPQNAEGPHETERPQDTEGLREAPDALRDLVRAGCRAALGRTHAPRHVLLTGALPLRGPGKVDRRGLTASAAQVLAGAALAGASSEPPRH